MPPSIESGDDGAREVRPRDADANGATVRGIRSFRIRSVSYVRNVNDDRAAQERYAYIDGLRAIAVLAVVAFHAIAGERLAHGLAPPALANVGARGVDLFFVLSGFCLALPFLRRARASGTLRIDYGTFLSRRFARIAPPYYAALAAFTLLAFTPFGYPSTWASMKALDGLGARELLPDVFFLTTVVPVANSSFWTLGLEMRWYFVCPLAIALFVRSRYAFAGVMLALYAAYYLLPGHILDAGTMPAFMLGIVAAYACVSSRPIGSGACFAAVLLLAGAVFVQSRETYVDHGNPLWQLAMFAIVVASRAEVPSRILSSRPFVRIGAASYSIYLVHLPVMDYVGRHGVPWILAAIVGTVAGFGFWYVVERPLAETFRREALAGRLRAVLRRYERPPIVVSGAS